MAIQRDKIIASAEKLVAKGKIEPAIKEYERLLDDNPSDVNTLNRIGDLWVRINRNDEAVKVFGRIADHYSRDGFFLKAIAIYKKINKLDPSRLDIYAKLADLYGKQGLAMEAKSQYQVLADYYLKHGDPGNALAIYRKISELDPNSINVHVKLADLYSQNNQTKEALKEYDRVGRMLLKRGMLDEAVQVFKKALKIDSSNIELVESLVTALLEAKDYDNALQIVQASLESAGENAKLLSVYGRILLAKGDARAARAALERAIASDPNDTGVRETLADLHLRTGNADGALDMLTPVVEKAVARGERGAAVELFNRILRVDAGHAPTLERLVALYTRLNEETNVLSAMSSLAEAHVARGRFENAAEVLEKLIQREPQNAQHRTKLQFVRTQIGGVDTMPARPTQAEVPVAPLSMEIEEPVPSFDSFDEEPALSFDLDASEPLELELDTSFEPPPPPVAPSPPPPSRTPTLSRMQSAVELAAIDLDAQDGSEDVDFVTEHLTEAEVFAKYGLTEKATEHLRAIIERAPKHLAAHEKLYRLLLDDGDVDGARAAASQYMTILQEKGDAAAVKNIQDEFLMRGHSLLPPAPSAPPTMERPLPALEADEELSFDLDSGAPEFDLPAIEPEPAFSFDEPEPAIEMPAFEPEPALTFDAPAVAEEFSFDAAIDQVEPVFAPEPVIDAPSAEELRELDFYIEQELFDEARQKIDALGERFPDNAAVAERRTRFKLAMDAITAAPAPAPDAFAPAVLSRDEIESELLSALPDDDDDFFTPAPPPPPARAAAPPPPPPVHEENLFADEDDFFDLAAELESELEEESEEVSLSEEEQSLEEIFKEFKKGVEQQLDSEDYDTHYNLGIAYKEMGLIDEAIGEFQLASKDPKRAVECASMLGLCFLEKGMPQLAIKWYRKGLEMPEILAEENVGLLYDLGSAYLEVGDTDNAQKAFAEVYSLNSNYRDIVNRIKQLEDVRR
ncbi:MAG: tetratricopeptide repeat protein [Acidobacteria bacterium]|nr:tetratricopeptide repeat protein [Acidobacteriota bacterium]MBV9187823.1 tetratricopeptide repeat protein [Acidobacteriota bacterium]